MWPGIKSMGGLFSECCIAREILFNYPALDKNDTRTRNNSIPR